MLMLANNNELDARWFARDCQGQVIAAISKLFPSVLESMVAKALSVREALS
ncbi:conserved hypothetical protein [Ricinus communis]|uniref:Uncharacterized protein n=1 Tax=Ricinus communis TaxID=3988 RepID=B9SDT9_RICCO|nr:conserved hypothetical protein [Ricinus communis]